MSPRFYASVWVVFAAAAVLVWLVGSFTALAVVVFGGIAFGLIFMGMMCVLPGAVSHSHEHVSTPAHAPATKPEPAREASSSAYTYRSA